MIDLATAKQEFAPTPVSDDVADLAYLAIEASRHLDSAAPATRALVQRARALLRTRAQAALDTEVGGKLTPWRARRAVAFIDRNSDRNVQVRDVAAVVRLSPSYFSHAFRDSFGLSAKAFIIERRILRAKRLMLGSRSLAEIALDCGFSDQAHFSRAFSSVVGLSPNRWRRLQVAPDRFAA